MKKKFMVFGDFVQGASYAGTNRMETIDIGWMRIVIEKSRIDHRFTAAVFAKNPYNEEKYLLILPKTGAFDTKSELVATMISVYKPLDQEPPDAYSAVR